MSVWSRCIGIVCALVTISTSSVAQNVIAVGANFHGQLGIGDTVERVDPVVVPSLDKVAQISAGGNMILARRTDGSVWAWGTADGGTALGTGISGGSQLTPARVPLNATDISTSGARSMAIANGAVYAWGSTYLDIVNENSNTPINVTALHSSLAGAKQVSASRSDNMVVFANETVMGWGWNAGTLGDGTATSRHYPVAAIGGYSQVEAKGAYALNSFGQVYRFNETPKMVQGLSNIIKISAGSSVLMCLKSDGTVWTVGSALGNGTSESSLVGVQVTSLSHVVDIAAGDMHCLAMLEDGSIWAWGNNDCGQLGDGSKTTRLSPVLSSLSFKGVTALSASTWNSYGLVPELSNTSIAEAAFPSGSLVGGLETQLAITLQSPTTSRTSVGLSSSSTLIEFPSVVFFESGQQSKLVTVRSTAVSATNTVSIRVAGSLNSALAKMDLLPPKMSATIGTPFVYGGDSSIISLKLSSPAPVGGAGVVLQSSNAFVTLPSEVQFGPSALNLNVTVNTTAVFEDVFANITIKGLEQEISVPILVRKRPLPTARIRISPPVVSSESTAKATITLSGNAPVGGLVVELESDESAASVPSSITVPEGQKTATFNIVVGKVTEETYAYITATIDGVSSEASLTIRPKSIKPTTLSITESLVGGASGTGTITLSDPAPEGGLDIDLATNNVAVSLPLVVNIAAGSKTASFSFSTLTVSSTITATVSAKANGATVTDTIEVKVRPLGTLVASPSTLPGKATGTLTLTLSSPVSTPLTVNVTSSNAAVVLASKTITIAKGQSSGILKFTTTLVGADTTSTITCLSNGLEAKTDITVRSAKPSNVTLLPAVVLGGKGSIGTVTIDSAAPTSGFTVALSSSDSSAVVPSFVLVPSGKTSATFTITTSKVTSSKNVTITAQANGVSKTATLGVRILTIASISFNPVSVEGGVKANALLTLTDVAPLGGMTVTLGSDKAGVSVPSTVLVPAGKSSVAFLATTSVTGSSYDAKITGTANLETGSGMLKVLAPAVSSFTLSSTSVKGGDKPLGTVKIAKASSVDVVVSLSSSNADVASVPATVTIAKGQLLATFQVTTSKPSVATSVTLSATTGGLAKTVVLKVNP